MIYRLALTAYETGEEEARGVDVKRKRRREGEEMDARRGMKSANLS